MMLFDFLQPDDTPAAPLPAGAVYLPAFISTDEEQALAAALEEGVWSSELKRRVQHFGYRYDYRARAVTEDSYIGALPEWLNPLCQRLQHEGHYSAAPDQVIANEYLPGQGISAHVDCVPCFADTVASLSLLSACEMIFRHRKSGEARAIMLEPRSLIILNGPARYDWTHEIPARKSDVVASEKRPRERRISLTFRNVIRA